MQFVNLTPHQINIFDEDKELVLNVEPSGKVARIAIKSRKMAELLNVPLFDTMVIGEAHLVDSDGNVLDEQFPEQSPDIRYIVSGMFRMYFDRADLYQPGQLLRNDSGNPIGCIGLSR